VWHIDEDGAREYVPSDYNAIVRAVSFKLPHMSLFAVGYNGDEWDNPFEDVNEDDWFYDDVKYVNILGLMNGVSDKQFAPTGTMTRAMMVTILHRIHTLQTDDATPDATPEPTNFTDVPENLWYTEAIAWAASNDIVNGIGDNRFAPDAPITREQFATILLRYANYAGEGPQGNWAIRLDFADLDQISDWALEGAMFCSMKGIITGKPGNLFAPQGNTTRSEAAAMLHRYNLARNG
jgi:hypothetical protein